MTTNEQMTLMPKAIPTQTRVDASVEKLLEDIPDYTAPMTKAFKDSVKLLGVLQPIILIAKADGSYELKAGRRRLQAAWEAGQKTIPAVVVDSDGWYDDLLTIIENEHRSDNPAATLRVLEDLISNGKALTEADLNKQTGVPIQTIRSLLRLTTLSFPLRRAFDEGTVALSVAANAAKLPTALQKQLVEILGQKGKVTAEDVRAVRQVQSSATLAQMNLDSIVTPPPMVPLTWQAKARQRVQEALDVTPTEAGDVIDMLTGALAAIDAADNVVALPRRTEE